MKHEILTGPTTIDFKQLKSAYLPFIGSGFHNSYYLTSDFEYDICKTLGGTCGAPVVCSGDTFVGFLTESGGRIISDGSTIKVEIAKNQKAIMILGGSEKDKWDLYKRNISIPNIGTVEKQDFWYLPEYVTWVEQKSLVHKRNLHQTSVLDQEFVIEYMNRIKNLELPLGKLVLDDGWQQRISQEDWTDGYWKPNLDKFPDMTGLCHKIEDEGFVPSLWMGIPSVPTNAPIIKERPELFDKDKMICQLANNRFYYMPSDSLTEHFSEIIYPYIKMGFRKFKFDFFYGPRKRMRNIMKCLNRAVREIDPTVEIESHHADPFFSYLIDAFRMNDVIINPGYDWKGLTLAHLNLGINNAIDCILNLDHAGGNNPFVHEDDYINHIRLFDLVPEIERYPVLSLLPDHFTEKSVYEVKRYLNKHVIKNL